MSQKTAAPSALSANGGAPERTPLAALTGLRFVAAMLVVVFHFGGPYHAGGPAWLSTVYSHGYLSVGLFFFLSGFILTTVYVSHAPLPPARRGTYYLGRLARIYPLYLASLIMAAAVGLYQNVPPYAIVAQALLLQAWFPWDLATVTTGNYPGWSLSVEILCYAIFPFLPFSRLRQLRPNALLAAGTLLWIGSILGIASLKAFVGEGQTWFHVICFFPPLHLPVFLAGVLTGHWFFAHRPATKGWRHKASFIMPEVSLGLIYVGLLLGIRWLPFGDALLRTSLLVPAFCLLILGLAAGRSPLARLLGHPVLVRLGKASYAVYLLHVPLWYGIRSQQFQLAPPGAPHAVAFLVYLVLLILLSLAAYAWLEQPARHWLLGRFHRPEPPASTTERAA